MLLQLPKTKVNFIGDPHFGKRFGDVPLHRRGEREKMQEEAFNNGLRADADVIIMVGDLFDTFTVSHETLMLVFKLIESAVEDQPEKEFIFMMGNHDVSRDTTVVSSFDILAEMLEAFTNVTVAKRAIEYRTNNGDKILVCPYSEFKTAAEVVESFQGKKFACAVGHWDTDQIAGEHNLCPYGRLMDVTDIIVTGHVHTPSDTKVKRAIDSGHPMLHKLQESRLICTGSMMPYSHGEDPDGKVYVTRTLEQIAIELEENPEAYKYKCVRVILGPGEEPPQLDCLQFQIKKVSQEEKAMEVTMGDFSFQQLWKETFKENEVPDEISDHYWEKYRKEATDVTDA